MRIKILIVTNVVMAVALFVGCVYLFFAIPASKSIYSRAGYVLSKIEQPAEARQVISLLEVVVARFKDAQEFNSAILRVVLVFFLLCGCAVLVNLGAIVIKSPRKTDSLSSKPEDDSPSGNY